MEEHTKCNACNETCLFADLIYCANCDFKFCKECFSLYKENFEKYLCGNYNEYEQCSRYQAIFYERYKNKIICKKCTLTKLETFKTSFF